MHENSGKAHMRKLYSIRLTQNVCFDINRNVGVEQNGSENISKILY